VSLKALKSNTGNRDLFYYFAGLAAFESGDNEAAIQYLEECLKLNPYHNLAMFQLSKAYEVFGELEKSKKYLSDYEELNKTRGKIVIRDDLIGLRLL